MLVTYLYFLGICLLVRHPVCYMFIFLRHLFNLLFLSICLLVRHPVCYMFVFSRYLFVSTSYCMLRLYFLSICLLICYPACCIFVLVCHPAVTSLYIFSRHLFYLSSCVLLVSISFVSCMSPCDYLFVFSIICFFFSTFLC